MISKEQCVHFVGFRDERFWNAVRVWGWPDFVHRGWDLRAHREIALEDTIVFAAGPAEQEPRRMSFNDVDEVLEPSPDGRLVVWIIAPVKPAGGPRLTER